MRLIDNLTDGTLAYEQRTELEGVDYILTFQFDARRERWLFGIRSIDSEDLLTGQVINPYIPLNRRAVGGPPGEFRAIPTDGTYDPVEFSDLGGRVLFWYSASDEVASFP